MTRATAARRAQEAVEGARQVLADVGRLIAAGNHGSAVYMMNEAQAVCRRAEALAQIARDGGAE